MSSCLVSPRGDRRIPLVVANWKMNKTRAEALLLARTLVEELGDVVTAEVAVCPPFTALSVVADVIRGSNLMLGAQNMFYEASGAFTGEVSPVFLRELGCSYCIIGHSERRLLLGETDEIVQRKLKAAFRHGITPIVCVGETRVERNAGRTFERLEQQLQGSLGQAVQPTDVLVLAYEPVWAIGTGQNATPVQAAEVHRFLRRRCAELVGRTWAANLRILYGGSVLADNIDVLMAESEVDGVLAGGASLKPEFSRIVRFSAPAKGPA